MLPVVEEFPGLNEREIPWGPGSVIISVFGRTNMLPIVIVSTLSCLRAKSTILGIVFEKKQSPDGPRCQ